MKKIYYVILSFLIVILTFILLPKKTVNNTIKEDSFAFFVADENGTYTKSDTIPIGDYQIDEERTVCQGGGTVSDYNPSTGKIKYNLKSADKCTVYFIIDNSLK